MESNQTPAPFSTPPSVVDTGMSTTDTLVIPVIAEHLQVDKQLVETGRVRIVKTVREEQQTVDLPLNQDTIDVQRVAINQPVDAVPAVRQEGDTTIYPVLEEILVVEKRLMLVEEIRVTKRRETVSRPQQITVRREEVTVERMTPNVERPASQQEPSL